METGGARMSVRTWRRMRTLLLLDLGYTVTATAEALGTYRRETARIGKRYLAGGLSTATVYRLCELSELAQFRVSHTIRVRLLDLMSYVRRTRALTRPHVP